MKFKLCFILCISIIQMTYAQKQPPSFMSNSNLPFDKYISGVKYAVIGLNALNQEEVDKHSGIAGFYRVAQKYLYEIGFEYVALTSSEKTELEISLKSYCEYTQVIFGGNVNNKSISDMTISSFTTIMVVPPLWAARASMVITMGLSVRKVPTKYAFSGVVLRCTYL